MSDKGKWEMKVCASLPGVGMSDTGTWEMKECSLVAYVYTARNERHARLFEWKPMMRHALSVNCTAVDARVFTVN
jgi:hypothetical protein